LTRSFQYYATPDEVRHYLEEHGHQVKLKYASNGATPIGFEVLGTTIQLGYDLSIKGRIVGHGSISLGYTRLEPSPDNPNVMLVLTDDEVYQSSLRLYNTLYRRYRKPK
jgi:hypothetical protein